MIYLLTQSDTVAFTFANEMQLFIIIPLTMQQCLLPERMIHAAK